MLAVNMLVHAQTAKVNLHIILVDHELNQKPVPWFHVTLRREDSQNSEVFDLITKLDGTCERVVPTGRYELVTPNAIDLQGRRYSWSMDVTFSRAKEMLELTNQNAAVEQVPSSVSAPMNNVSGGGNDLSLLFERLKRSTVTVRADSLVKVQDSSLMLQVWWSRITTS